MKEITYQPKQTSASTQYNQISTDDMNYVLSRLIRYMALSSELRKSKLSVHSIYIEDFWSLPDKNLPKSKTGLNSPESFCAGIINNIMCGNQKDLSDIQMEAITYISDKIAEVMPIMDHIEQKLQPACKPFDKIIFKEDLFEIR